MITGNNYPKLHAYNFPLFHQVIVPISSCICFDHLLCLLFPSSSSSSICSNLHPSLLLFSLSHMPIQTARNQPVLFSSFIFPSFHSSFPFLHLLLWSTQTAHIWEAPIKISSPVSSLPVCVKQLAHTVEHLPQTSTTWNCKVMLIEYHHKHNQHSQKCFYFHQYYPHFSLCVSLCKPRLVQLSGERHLGNTHLPNDGWGLAETNYKINWLHKQRPTGCLSFSLYANLQRKQLRVVVLRRISLTKHLSSSTH